MYINLVDVQGAELDHIKAMQAIISCKRDISSLVGNRFESNKLDGVRVHFSKELKYAPYTIKKNDIFRGSNILHKMETGKELKTIMTKSSRKGLEN